MKPRLNLGRIDYLNCRPLYEKLQAAADNETYVLCSGNPAQLNYKLETGEIDISPSSSILPATSRENSYFILPDIAIASTARVHSVLLLSRRPPAELTGSRIALTSHSLTSTFLLRIILFKFLGLDPATISFTTREFAPAMECEAALVIGDQALQHYHQPPTGFQTYDLGHLWHHFTGLPFVYALWIGRREILAQKQEALATLHGQLSAIIAELPRDLENLSRTLAPETMFSARQLRLYWQEAISYRLDDKALAGLQLFYENAYELGLIDRIPELLFFPPSR
ncbi:MAG: menaquinone biosynthesis protein [Deltaproteobacteria bacterium]|nr:menaquinone biosynthesis protein [Deltaproteobacteria bacterium]